MSIKTFQPIHDSMPSGPHRQRGVTTLVISMVLMLAITILVLAVARTGLMEQRMFSNEYRSKEAAEAAEAGLEYGIAWLGNGTIPVWTLAAGEETAVPGAVPPPIIAGNGDQYNLSITYTRPPANPRYVEVTATAAAASDASSTATSRQHVYRKTALSTNGTNAPPLLLDGCMSGVTGSPDIYPEGFTAGSVGTAIVTSQPTVTGAVTCLDLGGMSVNGGSSNHNAFTPGQLWEYMFDISRAELQALADAEVAAGVADADRSFIWVTSSASFNGDWGSPAHPVVLVFASSSGCPTMDGNDIYGVVFHDGGCGANADWDDLTVYGSLAINGDITSLISNSEFRHWTEGGGSGLMPQPGVSAPKLLGTWHDFE